MLWGQRVRYASISDVGFRRTNNEDSYAVHVCAEEELWRQRGHLFMVADGMGGHAVGELASKIAVDTLPHTFLKHGNPNVSGSLRESITETNATIFERARQNREFERMGTTCSALVLAREGAIVGHVGDSRVYRVRGNRVDQLSFDHSLHWELARSGRMSLGDLEGAEGKNIITRCLGPDATVNVDIEGPHTIEGGDRFVVCSDGLTNHLKDEEIGLIAHELPPADACRLLVNLANLRGGSDNTTVIVVEVGDAPDGQRPEPVPPATVHGRNLWPWLLSAWGVAATFVVGLLLIVQDNTPAGLSVMIVALAASAGLLASWWRFHARTRDEPEQSSPNAPYRSARFRLDESFVTAMATLVDEFETTAREKGLTVRTQELHDTRDNAQSELDGENLREAFRLYAKAIDVMMDTVHEYRKQRNREQKWGRSNSSANDDE